MAIFFYKNSENFPESFKMLKKKETIVSLILNILSKYIAALLLVACSNERLKNS